MDRARPPTIAFCKEHTRAWANIFHALALTGLLPAADRLHESPSALLRFRRKWGGGDPHLARRARTINIHALASPFCCPVAFLMTGSQVADCTAADADIHVRSRCRGPVRCGDVSCRDDPSR